MAPDPFVKYASIIPDLFIDKLFDYGLTEQLAQEARKGMRVEIPIRGQLRTGTIYEIKEQPSTPRVKPVHRLLIEAGSLTDELFELAVWMSEYYCTPLRDVFQILLPSAVCKEGGHKQQLFAMRSKSREQLKEVCEQIRNKAPSQAAVLDLMLLAKKGMLLSELLEKSQCSRNAVDALVKKGLLSLETLRIDRSPLEQEEFFQTLPKTLNADQAAALDKIAASIEAGRFDTHLIHGITGSGKTEVYLQAIDRTLKLNKGAIMLVPEISLTAQTIERFRSRFEGKIAVFHHRLGEGERYDEWHKIRRGEARIAIGARSAVFTPMQNLGLIIVDEEHENSYKQHESMPCYHARDIAVMRGKITNSTVILGSATPSLESYYNGIKGKYTLSLLHSRPDSASLPSFTIVDMRKEHSKAGGYTNFSEQLLEGIKKRHQKGEQSILFLNRRGYHTTLICKECGHLIRCAHCDLGLTFHLGEERLSCHLCGFSLSPAPKQCPSCRSFQTMKYRGVGTELVERALQAILPDLRVMRIDADTTRHKGSHQKLLKQFGTGKADVLIGTQMIAKGLHFPSVTLAGVLNSDASLNIPDFRASETVFQLISQVAGRAGRGQLPGELIIQTCLPENLTIQLAASQNYLKFYEEEIQVRQQFLYPPFAKLAKLTFSGSHEEQVRHASETFRAELRRWLPKQVELYPIVPAGYAKVKDRYRFQLLMRGPSAAAFSQAIRKAREKDALPKSIHLLIDINPASTF